MTQALTAPGIAEVIPAGIVTIAGTDLDYINVGGHCTLKTHALKHTITVRHGSDHAITKQGPYGAIDAFRELRAIGVDLNKVKDHPPKAVRHSEDGARWIELRFAPESLLGRVPKTKSTTKVRK